MHKTCLLGALLLTVACGSSDNKKNTAPDPQPTAKNQPGAEDKPTMSASKVEPVQIPADSFDKEVPNDQDVCMRGVGLSLRNAKVVNGTFSVWMSYPVYSHNNYKLTTYGRTVRLAAKHLDALKNVKTRRAWFKRLKGETEWNVVANPASDCPKVPGPPAAKLPGHREDAKLPKDQDVCVVGIYLALAKDVRVKNGEFIAGISYPEYSHQNYKPETYGRAVRVKGKYLDAVKKLKTKSVWFKRLKGQSVWDHVVESDCPKRTRK